jgi:hypothetical protein
MQGTKPNLPVLGFAPDDIPKMTNNVVARTRVFEDIRHGKLRAKKVGKRTLVTAEEVRRYIEALPDCPAKPDTA